MIYVIDSLNRTEYSKLLTDMFRLRKRVFHDQLGWDVQITDGQETVVPDAACWRWWELSITATGVVSHCCMDGEAAYPIGDIREQSLLEIYNAPFWRERREKLLSRKVLDDRSPCSKCTY